MADETQQSKGPLKMTAAEAKAEIRQVVARLRAYVIHAESLGLNADEEPVCSSISEEEMAHALERLLGNFGY